jgi:phosphoserine phosphatase
MRKIKLICFDMDGVIFEHENFWIELHKALGTYEEGVSLTKKYVKNNYAKLVEEVVGRLWKGKSATAYFRTVKGAKYAKGCKETFTKLRKRKIKTAIFTSGPKHLAMRAKKELRIDHCYFNELVISKNTITGEFKQPMGYGHCEKAVLLEQLAKRLGLPLYEICFVGEGDNDIGACRKAGLSISFNSKSKELDSVCDIVIKKKDLRQILGYA